MASEAPVADPRWNEVGQHRPTALRLLRRTFPALRGQHDDIWQEVATALFARSKAEGFWPNELRSYLLGAVGRNAANKLRTARSRDTHPSDPQSGELARLAAAPVDEQVLGELDAENYRSVIRSLNPRQRAVAKLRFDWGLPTGEIAELLGIETKRCYRDLERATVKVRRQARRIQAGEHVREWEVLFDRYLAGSATAAQRAEAQLLLDTNPQARSIAVAMYRQTRQLAELLPVPALGEAANGQGSHLADLFEATRQQLTDGAGAAKQHAAGALARVDPTPLAGARPGAATAAIVGCLAISGGAATYCVENGVNPFDGVEGLVQSQPAAEPKPEPSQEKKPAAEQPPDPPVIPPVAQEEPVPAPTPEPATQQVVPEQPSPPPPAPAPEPQPEPTPAPVEFGEPASAPPAPPAQPQASAPARPAPAPPGGSEFGP